jgi:hypothetical protein
VADINPTFVEKSFDISKRQWKSDVHEHTKSDDFRRCFEVAKRIFRHGMRLFAEINRLKVVCADNAFLRVVIHAPSRDRQELAKHCHSASSAERPLSVQARTFEKRTFSLP